MFMSMHECIGLMERLRVDRIKCPVCQSSEAVFKCSFGAWNCADCGVAFEPETGKLLEPEEEKEARNA